MKTYTPGYSVFLLTVFALFLTPLFGQEEGTCKVLLSGIDQTYEGTCKNGLAHGKGTATGVDTYEGTFKKGMPDGFGKYTWANGDTYTGEWKQGQRHGRGLLNEGGEKSIAEYKARKGYWKKGELVYEVLESKYKFHRKRNLTRASAKKLDEKRNYVTINIQGAPSITDLEVLHSSGLLEYPNVSRIVIREAKFPLDVVITYNSVNKFNTMSLNIVADMTLESAGNWLVNLGQ